MLSYSNIDTSSELLYNKSECITNTLNKTTYLSNDDYQKLIGTKNKQLYEKYRKTVNVSYKESLDNVYRSTSSKTAMSE